MTLLFSSALTGWKCAGDDIVVDPCLYLESPPDVLQDNILYATNDDINIENFRNYRKRSKVNPARKPLLLWLQGSPGVSSLFSQFLANGPLGIDADGKLYHRTYSLIRDFNVIYLDQPAGAGYSFSEKEEYPGTLDEVALQVGRFLRRFLRIFTECSNPAAWEDVLRNVMRAINRELTIRGIKERVDLLIGYFRQQDTVNLRKSGTEEQYGEREQLLQDVSDLMREVNYAPRTVPRKANGMGLSKKKTAWGHDSPLNN
ncbi:hypothetical protein MRX96_023965 [Rhipicephalus microplus]